MAESETTDNGAAAGAADQKGFAIQQIYVKDLSFESPSPPYAFREQWQPQVEMQLDTTATQLASSRNTIGFWSVSMSRCQIGSRTTFIPKLLMISKSRSKESAFQAKSRWASMIGRIA